MSTKRKIIETFREELRERSADSTYTNQFLYNELSKHAKWLIRREVTAGRIYINNSIFQTLSCIPVIETSTIDPCCPVKTNCKIYRTKEKLPEMWVDTNGPVLKSVSSVDGTTDFFYTNATTWQSKRIDPYNTMSDTKYSFFADGYLWFPENNPHRVNVLGFFTEDISDFSDDCDDCKKKKPCTRFLDTNFQLPDWLEAEMFSHALESVAGITKKLPEDEQIDKNPNRKN
jgi:hypothetical protein